MTTTVVNRRRANFDVYIGRPGKWGNPFKIGQEYHGMILNRATCLEAYRDWLLYSDEGIRLLADLSELKDKRLGCFCKPLACHGDILAELVNGEFDLERHKENLLGHNHQM